MIRYIVASLSLLIIVSCTSDTDTPSPPDFSKAFDPDNVRPGDLTSNLGNSGPATDTLTVQ